MNRAVIKRGLGKRPFFHDQNELNVHYILNIYILKLSCYNSNKQTNIILLSACKRYRTSKSQHTVGGWQ